MFANSFETCHADGCGNRATRLHLRYPVCDAHTEAAAADSFAEGT